MRLAHSAVLCIFLISLTSGCTSGTTKKRTAEQIKPDNILKETSLYIGLDHKLVPRKLEDINDRTELPGRNFSDRRLRYSTNLLNKYDVKQGNVQDILIQFEKEKQARKDEPSEVDVKDYEPVVGPSEEVYYDEDLGFFSTILACYNNHWILKTSPDDWWNVIVRVVAQAIEESGDKDTVRKLFVDHEGKKTISVIVGGPGSWATVEYGWLFDQFAKGIKLNIKKPEYVDIMQADFSTTTSKQLISSQVMLMSSMQKYFEFRGGTACGIPGVEMKGVEEDWKSLQNKTKVLEQMLMPIMAEIGLKDWFQSCHGVLNNLLLTFQNNPDKKWWSHILSWNRSYGSGSDARSWWDGWFIDFIRPGTGRRPSKVRDFQSGTVGVPIHLYDNSGPEDVGLLVAGTVGYTVKEDEKRHTPVVEANQAWVLLLPRNSSMTSILTGGDKKRIIN